MGTWICFYVKASNKSELVGTLQSVSGAIDVTEEQPGNLANDLLPSTNSAPDRFILSQTQPEWITVFHNSFDKLEELALGISEDLNTSVIVTIAQSVSDYYYFGLYSNGYKRREIEVCYNDDSQPMNLGERLPFEEEEPGKKVEHDGEVSYLFGFDSLEKYGEHFGLRMSVDVEQFTWTVVEHPKYKLVAKLAVQRSKPWWKFWQT